MTIRIISAIFFIFCSLNIFANIDSVGVENNNGKKLILHKVEAKETYYSLGRKYQVTPGTIMASNNNKALQPGDILRIPTDRPFLTENAPQIAIASTNDIITEYVVGPKETLNLIARRFNTTAEDIRQLNNIQGSLLSIGQVLKVRSGRPVAEVTPPATPKPEITTPVPEEAETAKTETVSKVPLNRYGLREQSERGVAIWTDDENVDGTKLLVLHRTAPIGTVMKITNPLTEKSTFAKVVGKFTENENTKDIIIIVTKATAGLIGAMDKRFQVSIDYGLSE